MTARLLAPVLIAVGVLVSAWPLGALFDEPRWLGPLLTTMAVVVLTGIVGRALAGIGRRRGLVVLAQTLALTFTLMLFFAGPTLRFGVIPTPATLDHLRTLADQAVDTIRTSPPPAPAGDGVVMLLTTALAVIHLLGDVVAVTLRRPALSGLVLLMPLLTAVANSDGSLPVAFFALTTLCWLALLALQERADLRAWFPTRQLGADAERGSVALALAAGGLALAIVAASAIPHAPARYLADGLGRDGIGRGSVGYSPSADILRDLESSDDSPVLTYRTDDSTPPPLRVGVADRYLDGRWYPHAAAAPTGGRPTLRYPSILNGIQRTQHSFDVEHTRLQAPYLATPADITRLSVAGADWVHTDDIDVVSVDRTPSHYSAQYLQVVPSPNSLDRDEDVDALTDINLQAALNTDESTEMVRRLAREAAGSADTAQGQATAIQNWLRSGGGFTYSLTLAPLPAGMSERDAGIDRFLVTKQGYCVQFATAMVLMARELGIPARAVTGFLPGTRDGESRRVLASDAHMWPELYFEHVGWMRFEPTPGVHAGSPPRYAPEAAQPTSGATPSATPTTQSAAPSASASGGPTAQRRPDLDAGSTGANDTESSDVGATVRVISVAVALLAAVGAGALVLPLLGARTRRRERGAAHTDGHLGDAVEVRWDHLLEEAADLGIDVDLTSTLARQHRGLTLTTLLDPEHDDALGRVVAAVEAARYARDPRIDLTALDADLATVSEALRRSRRRRERALAWLRPSAGRRALRALRHRWRPGRHDVSTRPQPDAPRQDSMSGRG